MQERRLETRMMCADMIEVRWNQGARTRHTVALLEDISPSGACLQMEAPLQMGMRIHWETPQQKFSGTVCYCEYREIGYFIGVEFAPGTRWSEEDYQPQHLLDPKHVVPRPAKPRGLDAWEGGPPQ
jgi:hypothetical protein